MTAAEVTARKAQKLPCFKGQAWDMACSASRQVNNHVKSPSNTQEDEVLPSEVGHHTVVQQVYMQLSTNTAAMSTNQVSVHIFDKPEHYLVEKTAAVAMAAPAATPGESLLLTSDSSTSSS